MKIIGFSLSLAMMLLACTPEDGDGIVDVRWAIGATSCTRAGVERVTVLLIRNNRAVATTEARCDDGEVAVEGVAGGRYSVRVFGYRLGSENPDFVGQEAGIDVPKGGRVTTPVILLSEAPGAIDLSWQFESGQLCRFEGSDWIRISVFDERNRLVFDAEVPCDPDASVGEVEVTPGSEYLEDARGYVVEFLFSGPHSVVVLGYVDEDDEEATWGGAGTGEVESFELTPVNVVLALCTEDPDSVCF